MASSIARSAAAVSAVADGATPSSATAIAAASLRAAGSLIDVLDLGEPSASSSALIRPIATGSSMAELYRIYVVHPRGIPQGGRTRSGCCQLGSSLARPASDSSRTSQGRSGPAACSNRSNISYANKSSGSQVGRQRRQSSGHAGPHPAESLQVNGTQGDVRPTRRPFESVWHARGQGFEFPLALHEVSGQSPSLGSAGSLPRSFERRYERRCAALTRGTDTRH